MRMLIDGACGPSRLYCLFVLKLSFLFTIVCCQLVHRYVCLFLSLFALL